MFGDRFELGVWSDGRLVHVKPPRDLDLNGMPADRRLSVIFGDVAAGVGTISLTL